MATVIDKLGELHTDFGGLSFHDFLMNDIKIRENERLLLGNPTDTQMRIHDAGFPTIGYGFDLGLASFELIREQITWAYDGTLTELQQEGLDIIEIWKSGGVITDRDGNQHSVSANDILKISADSGALDTGSEAWWTDAQRNALRSLTMTDAQALILPRFHGHFAKRPF